MAPERHDHLRPDRSHLRTQEGLASRDLIRLRIPIVRRPALHDVRYVYVAALHRHAAFDDASEELAGFADEGLALAIFVLARTFADEHDLRTWIADSEDDLGAPLRREL